MPYTQSTRKSFKNSCPIKYLSFPLKVKQLRLKNWVTNPMNTLLININDKTYLLRYH